MESWLRQHQVQQSGELLVITGRGNNSEGGVSPSCAKRRSVSFTSFDARASCGSSSSIRLDRSSSASRRWQRCSTAGKRRREQAPPPRLPRHRRSPRSTARRATCFACSPSARSMRWAFASAGPFVESEMLRLFGMLASSAGEGPDREAAIPCRDRHARCESWTDSHLFLSSHGHGTPLVSQPRARHPRLRNAREPIRRQRGRAGSRGAADARLRHGSRGGATSARAASDRSHRAQTPPARTRAPLGGDARRRLARPGADPRLRDPADARDGTRTEVRSYRVFLPHPTSVKLWRTAPTEKALPLVEPTVAGDRARAVPQYPTVNGYSGVGDVDGRGRLRELRTDRGLRSARLARRLGSRAHRRRALRPLVPRHQGARSRAAWRGRAADLQRSAGRRIRARATCTPKDRCATGTACSAAASSTARAIPRRQATRARRTRRACRSRRWTSRESPSCPSRMRTRTSCSTGCAAVEVPDGWQGGLPFRYHIGPGPVRARVQVTDDRATNGTKPIYNTFGIVRRQRATPTSW